MKNDTAGGKSKKNTLNAVARKAMAEPEFWKKLRKDRGAALKEAGFNLDAREYARLEAIMARDGKTITVDLDKMMARVHARRGQESAAPGGGNGGDDGFGGLTWVGMWEGPGEG